MEEKKQYTETNQTFYQDNGGCQKSAFGDFISKPEINFWTPIIFTVVTISMSFMALKSQVDLQNQKLDTLIAGQNVLIEKYEGIQARVGINERDITLLNTNQSIVLKNLGIK